jgi:hypothetical protein
MTKTPVFLPLFKPRMGGQVLSLFKTGANEIEPGDAGL